MLVSAGLVDPAFTMTTNGGSGILQACLEILFLDYSGTLYYFALGLEQLGLVNQETLPF